MQRSVVGPVQLFSPYFTRCIKHDTEHTAKGLTTENQVSSEFENKRQANDGDVQCETGQNCGSDLMNSSGKEIPKSILT